jgi:BolA protein
MITSNEIKTRLQNALNAEVEVIDESHFHAGHEGAKSGGGHFRVNLKSPQFNGLKTLERHRLVYHVLSDWMNKDIHALAIDSTIDASGQ